MRIKPSNLVVSLPELTGLVNVDLASLLSVSPAELLADLEGVDASLENATLAAEVRCTAKAERGSKLELSLVQEMAVCIVGKGSLLPFHSAFSFFSLPLSDSRGGE